MYKVILSAIIILATQQAYAARAWAVLGAEILSVEWLHNGGSSIVALKYRSASGPISGYSCAGAYDASTDIGAAVWKNTNNPSVNVQGWASFAAAAQAQGALVDIYMDSGCKDTEDHAGQEWAGIRIHQAQ